MSLAVKYRPHKFEDVCGQTSIIKILQNQIQTKTFSNCYMFCGASGCGKTTIARIMADEINNHQGQPIEIDGASNNGVENVRMISDDAQERSLDSEYKVYIIDECHALSNNAWQAFLKTIEEPPKYTLFFFCTTESYKVPQTIMNRCQVFTFGKVPTNNIINRLGYICQQEHFTSDSQSLELISRIAEGSMRQAITYLDKCKDYSTTISEQVVKDVLGDYSYNTMLNLTFNVINKNTPVITSIIDNLYNSGVNLQTFISNYLDFILQINKYILLKSMDGVNIPLEQQQNLNYLIGMVQDKTWFKNYIDKVLDIKRTIKGDLDPKTTMEVMLISC